MFFRKKRSDEPRTIHGKIIGIGDAMESRFGGLSGGTSVNTSTGDVFYHSDVKMYDALVGCIVYFLADNEHSARAFYLYGAYDPYGSGSRNPVGTVIYKQDRSGKSILISYRPD